MENENYDLTREEALAEYEKLNEEFRMLVHLTNENERRRNEFSEKYRELISYPCNLK